MALESRRQPEARPVRDAAVVTAAYAALTLLFTWPLALRLGSVVPSDLGDPLFNAWVLAWDASRVLRALGGDLSVLAQYWDANIFYPHQYTLAYSDHQTAQALRILPVYAATHNPILAYNVNFLLTYVLSGLGMFLLVRELTGNRRAAFVAGLAFAFAPFRAGSLPHAQVLSSEWMPFALFGFARFFRTQRTVPLVGGALAWLLQNLSCGYYLLFFSPFVPLYLVWELTRRGLWRTVRIVWMVAAATAGTILLTVPFLLPYLQLRRLGFEARPLWEVEAYSADVLSFLTADDTLRLWGHVIRAWPHPEGWLFPGVTILALAVAACIVAWRDTATPIVRPAYVRALAWITLLLLLVVVAQLAGWSIDVQLGPVPLKVSRISRTLLLLAVSGLMLLAFSPSVRARLARLSRTPASIFAIIAVLSALLALGPSIHSHGEVVSAPAPYFWLYAYVPGWDGLRVPARFGMIVALALAVLAGVGLADAERTRRRTALVVVAGLAILVESAAFPIRINGEDAVYRQFGFTTTLPGMVDASRVPAVYTRVSALPERAVLLELPLGDPTLDVQYMIASTTHWRRLVNGYSGGFPADYALLAVTLDDAPAHPELAAASLQRSGATHVILHEAAYPADKGLRVAEWLRSAGARELGHDGPDRLFVLAPGQ